MIDGFNSAVSGLNTASIRNNVSAHDVANINTKGFEERNIEQVELPKFGGTRVASITKTPNPSHEFSNTDLTTETIEGIKAGYDFKANAKTLKAHDEMLGDLMDIVA